MAHPITGLPFRGSEAVAAGLLSRRQLCGPSWRRLFPDVYVHSSVACDHRVRSQAAGIFLGGRGVVSGRSAAYLWGADILPPGDPPVEITTAKRFRAPDGLTVVRSVLLDGDATTFAGTPVTSAVRTGFDLARRPPLREAVVALDALLHRRVVFPPELRRMAASRDGWPGLPRLRSVLLLADARAESPMESRLRLLLIAGKLPRPTVQHPVYDAVGRFVARLDLAYVERRLGVEYEGDHHRDRPTFQFDLRRINNLRALGWTVLRFGADDVLRDPRRVVAQVRAALTS